MCLKETCSKPFEEHIKDFSNLPLVPLCSSCEPLGLNSWGLDYEVKSAEECLTICKSMNDPICVGFGYDAAKSSCDFYFDERNRPGLIANVYLYQPPWGYEVRSTCCWLSAFANTIQTCIFFDFEVTNACLLMGDGADLGKRQRG